MLLALEVLEMFQDASPVFGIASHGCHLVLLILISYISYVD